MSRLLLVIILSFSMTSFNKTEFVEVRIQSGLTVHGSKSITLLKEGLLYRRDDILSNHEEEMRFVLFKDLDIEKAIEIQKYIRDNGLYDIESVPIPESAIVSNKNSIRLSFTVINKRQYNSYLYRYCDERIDELIKRMNQLLPEEDRARFNIIPKC